MKIDFNHPFLDLEGTVIKTEDDKEINLSKEFGKYLAADAHKESGIDPLDAFETAQKLHKLETIDFTSNQQELYKKWIKSTPYMTSLLKGQLLQLFIKKE
jgi:hypothetical protein